MAVHSSSFVASDERLVSPSHRVSSIPATDTDSGETAVGFATPRSSASVSANRRHEGGVDSSLDDIPQEQLKKARNGDERGLSMDTDVTRFCRRWQLDRGDVRSLLNLLPREQRALAMRRFRCDPGRPPQSAFKGFLRSCRERGFPKWHWTDDFDTWHEWQQHKSVSRSGQNNAGEAVPSRFPRGNHSDPAVILARRWDIPLPMVERVLESLTPKERELVSTRFLCTKIKNRSCLPALRAFVRSCQTRGFSERHWADKFSSKEQWERPRHEHSDDAWAQDAWVQDVWHSRGWSHHCLRGAEADWTGPSDRNETASQQVDGSCPVWDKTWRELLAVAPAKPAVHVCEQVSGSSSAANFYEVECAEVLSSAEGEFSSGSGKRDVGSAPTAGLARAEEDGTCSFANSDSRDSDACESDVLADDCEEEVTLHCVVTDVGRRRHDDSDMMAFDDANEESPGERSSSVSASPRVASMSRPGARGTSMPIRKQDSATDETVSEHTESDSTSSSVNNIYRERENWQVASWIPSNAWKGSVSWLPASWHDRARDWWKTADTWSVSWTGRPEVRQWCVNATGRRHCQSWESSRGKWEWDCDRSWQPQQAPSDALTMKVRPDTSTTTGLSTWSWNLMRVALEGLLGWWRDDATDVFFEVGVQAGARIGVESMECQKWVSGEKVADGATLVARGMDIYFHASFLDSLNKQFAVWVHDDSAALQRWVRCLPPWKRTSARRDLQNEKCPELKCGAEVNVEVMDGRPDSGRNAEDTAEVDEELVGESHSGSMDQRSTWVQFQ